MATPPPAPQPEPPKQTPEAPAPQEAPAQPAQPEAQAAPVTPAPKNAAAVTVEFQPQPKLAEPERKPPTESEAMAALALVREFMGLNAEQVGCFSPGPIKPDGPHDLVIRYRLEVFHAGKPLDLISGLITLPKFTHVKQLYIAPATLENVFRQSLWQPLYSTASDLIDKYVPVNLSTPSASAAIGALPDHFPGDDEPSSSITSPDATPESDAAGADGPRPFDLAGQG